MLHACRLDGTCFVGIHGFRSAFLFSIETQQTIGGWESMVWDQRCGS